MVCQKWVESEKEWQSGVAGSRGEQIILLGTSDRGHPVGHTSSQSPFFLWEIQLSIRLLLCRSHQDGMIRKYNHGQD